MVEGGPWGDSLLQEGVYQAIVEVQSGLERLLFQTRGQDAGPGNGEAIRRQPEVGHHLHVLLPAVVVVTGHRAALSTDHLAGGVAEAIPDRLPAAIGVDGSLDLVAAGGSAEDKSFWKAIRHREFPLQTGDSGPGARRSHGVRGLSGDSGPSPTGTGRRTDIPAADRSPADCRDARAAR